MIRSATTTLCPDQLAQYDRDGYLIVKQMFDADEVKLLIDTFMDLVADGPVEGLSSNHGIEDKTDPLWHYARLMHPHFNAPTPDVRDLAMRFMLDPRIGNVLRDLFGEEPLAAQSMYYFKPPGARGQDFHQDNFYLRVRPGSCMAAWVALDPADPDNGGMSVVPGSHKLDVLCPDERTDNETFFTGHHIDTPQGMQKVPTHMDAGDCLFFNGSLIHGSYPNTSADRFRRSFICHYAPVSCQERAGHYRLYDFDGNTINRDEAQGGGPCGEEQPRPTRAKKSIAQP